MERIMSRFAAAMLPVGLAWCAAAAAEDRVQTDWSGGPGLFGPVPAWGDRFDADTDVAWRSIPGQLALSGGPRFPAVQTVIALNAHHPQSCAVGDVDGDGDMDVITCTPIYGYPHGWIWWWERLPDGSWSEHVVDNDFYGAENVNVADMDGDGDLDVLGAAYYGLEDYSPYNDENGRYAWFENLNGDGSAWTQHLAGEMFWGARYIDAGDIDGDGDMDLVGAAELTNGVWAQDGDITWFENLDGAGTQWEQHELEWDVSSSEAHLVDLDGDGDLDVVGAEDCRIVWWENRYGDASAWLKRYVTTELQISTHLDVGDIDNDGDLDIVGGSFDTTGIYWWENTAGNGTVWVVHPVIGWPNTWMDVLVDIDGDGDLDESFTSLSAAHWVENVSGNGLVWEFREVTYYTEAPWLAWGDVNGDGRLDAVVTDEDSTNQQVHQVAWYDATQFNSSGELVSSVLEGGTGRRWGSATWNALEPPQTTLAVYVRASDDVGNLGPFWAVPAPGTDLATLIDPGARYLQYRFDLASSDAMVSPVVTDIAVRQYVPGDLNCDGGVDFADINPFVLVLTDPATWQALHPDCPVQAGDINGDGAVDFGDINPFVELLTSAPLPTDSA
jgi:hypothetical protein